MLRILFLLTLIIVVASFPLINNWISRNDKKNYIDRNAVELIIEDYIHNNPHKILESISTISNRPSKEENGHLVNQFKDQILDKSYPSAGNKESKAIVVEFFDYSCGYCKIMAKDIKQIISDNKVLYIFRDLPILGENSLKAANAALAVHLIYPEKYIDFYYAALSHKGAFDDNAISEIVQSIGVDKEEFNKSLSENSVKINELIVNSKQLARNLKISGTPSTIIGDKLLIGALDLSTLQNKIQKAINN